MADSEKPKRRAWNLYPLKPGAWQTCHIDDLTTPAGQTVKQYRKVPGRVTYLDTGERPLTTVMQVFYLPTTADLEIVQRWLPTDDPYQPPWARIEAELIVAGQELARLKQVNAPTLLMLLDKVRDHSDGEDSSPEWQSITEAEKQINRLSPTDCSILILGETGTGKEFYAERIHKASSRKNGPFVVINCATLPKERIDSELFGHVKGAFTGATQDYPGKIRQAEGGTVFLDEIGALPSECWGNLLRFLQAKEIHPLGGKTTTVNVRVLSATNKSNRVPEDALHRFDHVLHLPPLRERRGDIPTLAKDLFASAKQEGTRSSLRFPQGERAKLGQADHAWPGNIRQLRKAIERAIRLHDPGRDLTAQEVLDAAKVTTDPA